VDRDPQLQRQAITLPEPMSTRGTYSSPGYYVIDQAGNPVSDRYDSQAQAYANLKGGAGVQYLDQPQPGHLNQPWPPELHTVVGHSEGAEMSYTESDLLRAMAKTTDREEQRYLMAALSDLRREQHQVLAAANQVDFAPPHRVGEERPFYPYHAGAFGTSSATDWLGEIGASDDGMAEHMLTMGSRFFIGCHPEVKADPVEYMTQALGVARVAASQFANVEGAVTIFMDHVANLARVDLSKVAVDQLLPWGVTPEILPPVSTDEYTGPYSKDLNTEKNEDHDLDPSPGLDNGASGRATMAGLSMLSSHPHMSEFLFDPPTPEELAAASGPENLDKNPNISGNQDASSGSFEDCSSYPGGGAAITMASRHQAADDDDDGEDHYKYIHHRPGHKDSEGNEAPWVVTQKGTGDILSSHGSEAEAKESFRAMMMSKHNPGQMRNAQYSQHSGNFELYESPANYEEEGRREADQAAAQVAKLKAEAEERRQEGKAERGHRDLVNKESSRAQAPQQMTYEEYLARLSPGSYPVVREFFSGAMAAHAPSENDPTVPEWGRRQGPKASVTERPAPFRGVTTRIAASDEEMQANAQSGVALQGLLHHFRHEHPEQLENFFNPPGYSEYQPTVQENLETAQRMHQWDHDNKDRLPLRHDHPIDRLSKARTAANEDMLNPQAFERADESPAPAIRPQSGGNYDPEDTWEQSGEAAHDVTGLIPQTDLSETFSNISDFPATGPTEVPSTRRQSARGDISAPAGVAAATVPVEGNPNDQAGPQGEAWPWEVGPVGAVPRGASEVADVPTAGMVAAEQTGNSYPQPMVARNARLDAWRATIAAHTAKGDKFLRPAQMVPEDFLDHMSTYHGIKTLTDREKHTIMASPDAMEAFEKAHNIQHDLEMPTGHFYGPDHSHDKRPRGESGVGEVGSNPAWPYLTPQEHAPGPIPRSPDQMALFARRS
jgi:hypothetical protein